MPPDYYEHMAAIEATHWWYRGMRAMTGDLLAKELSTPGLALLDAGCGAGGFLGWIEGRGDFGRLVGADLSRQAIETAAERFPGLELVVAPLDDLPFEGSSFDVLTINDVLQHVAEDRVDASLRECARVLRPGGTLLVRTNGTRHLRRERADWRVYDRASLAAELRDAGFTPETVTYAALVPSLWAAARGHASRAPTDGEEPSHGIPAPVSGGRQRLGLAAMAAERRWIAGGRRTVPFGHTLFARARSWG